jgi:hypothetical protein
MGKRGLADVSMGGGDMLYPSSNVARARRVSPLLGGTFPRSDFEKRLQREFMIDMGSL